MAEATSTMRSLERAIDVLEVLDSSGGPLRLTEVARLAGLPVATTQRILNTLEARDRVERDAYGYRPGIGLTFGAHAYSISNPLIRAARPILAELAVATDHTATLFREHRGQRVVLVRADTARNLLGELVVGSRLPLFAGAGKAILADCDDQTVRELLGADVIPAGVGPAAPSWEALAPELERIRERGYSVSLGERDPGIGSVAASLQLANGIRAAVQLSGPISQFRSEDVQQDLGHQVRHAAYRLAQQAVRDNLA